MKKEDVIKVVAIIISCLFVYAGLSKLADYEKSSLEMVNQVFPNWIASILIWLIPAIELTLAALLVIQVTRKKALWASLILLSLFSVYIAVVMTGIFGKVPCSCGGILKNMSYGTHLIFNLFFVLLISLGLAFDNGWTAYNRLLNLKKRKGSIQSSV
ncbi:DoxX-like family protein [Pedobacter gandavensis]|uniref:MauE/DoxX family redox-associated membrane protein n=1 Tax=Pedobacter TaxID=84567 RepID=UPI001C98E90F|nr:MULTISPECIES: MauE/DoxX family redox-associated membrane protein [Pedobacter]WGQ09039.1 DoxX-like family protein [Pedobacter gandavensis]